MAKLSTDFFSTGFLSERDSLISSNNYEMTKALAKIMKNTEDNKIFEENEHYLKKSFINSTLVNLFKKYGYDIDVWVGKFQTLRSKAASWLQSNAKQIKGATFGTDYDDKENDYKNSYDIALRAFYKISSFSEEVDIVYIYKNALVKKDY